MSVLRFLSLLSIVVWIGGIAFLAFVLAPTAFHPGFLPRRHLAGAIVGQCLSVLHWMGVTCGVVFLVTAIAESKALTGFATPLALRNLLIVAMIVLTLISMFAISTRTFALRNDMVVIDNVA